MHLLIYNTGVLILDIREISDSIMSPILIYLDEFTYSLYIFMFTFLAITPWF